MAGTTALIFFTAAMFCGLASTVRTSERSRRSTDHQNDGNKLLAILVDGFRWDYFDNFAEDELPGFKALTENGVKADHLIAAFPTKSYVNHYSIMTGLFAENHGIIANEMFDEKTGEVFIWSTQDQFHPFWWEDGEPLWITAKKQGKNASLWFWTGCEVEIDNFKPDHCSRYQNFTNPSFQNFSWALDEALDALQNTQTHFAGIYLQAVDWAGHESGPGSSNVKQQIRLLDQQLVRLQDQLSQRALHNVNLMVFSDHGMSDISNTSCVNLTDVIEGIPEENLLHVSWGGPLLSIWTAPGKQDDVYNQIKAANVSPGNFAMYKKEDVPERYHYKNHPRIPALTLTTDAGYSFLRPGSECNMPGQHGNDNTNPDLYAIFLARGPDFKKGFKQPGFSCVEIYQVMCHVLGLEPSPNNGSWNHVVDMLVISSAPSQSFFCGTSNLVVITVLLMYKNTYFSV